MQSKKETSYLFWRGDSRVPAIIFNEGFLKRDEIATTYNHNQFEQKKGIGASSDINAAVLFPTNSTQVSWVYLINPQRDNLPYNLHEESLKQFYEPCTAALGEVVKEQVFEQVSSGEIVAAIAIQRTLLEEKIAVAYRMIDFELNPHCNIAIPNYLEEAIRENILKGRTLNTAVTSLGYKLKLFDRVKQAELFISNRDKLLTTEHPDLVEHYDSLLKPAFYENREGFFYKAGAIKGALKLPGELISDYLSADAAINLAQTCKEASFLAEEGMEQDVIKPEL